MTFPTIIYVFRTDVVWLPTGHSRDIYITIWDTWFGNQVLSGQVDRYFTNLIFYPDGVSLAFNPLFLVYSMVINAFQVVMPLSNAISLSYLLIIISCSLSAYVYLHWLLKDRWISQFGAIIFGFSANVFGAPYWPTVSWIATIPLALYCFHRGIREQRPSLIVCAGLLTGLTSTIIMYHYVCLVLMLAFYIVALAGARWRKRLYWQHVLLLIVVVALSSAWRLIPMLQNSDALGTALDWQGTIERSTDLVSFFVDNRHPVYGPLADAILQTPEDTRTSWLSFLGYLPLILIVIGMLNRSARRKMLPWLVLCLVFLVLRLGSTLNINGTVCENILLPKYYLNQLLPHVFQPFRSADHFMAGARLPLAVLSCFGLVALRDRFPLATRPAFVLFLIAVVAFEYYIPIQPDHTFAVGGRPFTKERVAFVDWLGQEEREENQEISLINVPMGRNNSKLYLFYQSLHGYPQTEGAISRTPDSAYDYIRSNYVLNGWYNQREVTCGDENRISYLTALGRLEDDGFSHVVFYRDFYDWQDISDSFLTARSSYSDDYVSIYRMRDLRESCQ